MQECPYAAQEVEAAEEVEEVEEISLFHLGHYFACRNDTFHLRSFDYSGGK